MSRLQRDIARAMMPPPPPTTPSSPSNHGSDAVSEDDSSSSASSISSAGTIRPDDTLRPLPTFAAKGGYSRLSKSNSFDPLDWHSCFAQDLHLARSTESEDVSYHVYITSPSSNKDPLFVMHHGAGSSGLSFAILAARLRTLLPQCGFLSLDARGHGETNVKPRDTRQRSSLDLTLETLSSDLAYVIEAAEKIFKLSPDQYLIFVGHSLGSAVITRLVNQGIFKRQTIGYAVVDVVEGSAIDALMSMQAYLQTRPSSFESVEKGIEWHLRTRTLRDPDSARTSVPSLLVAHACESRSSWTWRTDLAATEPFWEKWFTGLSSGFLAGSGAKLLILAGTDRLDKELIIGQMQGKFQLEIVPDAGHFVHEDVPAKIAEILAAFWHRNDRSKLLLPLKVS